MNAYRNAHHFTLDKAKKVFKEQIQEQIAPLPKFSKIHIEVVMYPRTKRLFDVGNVGSVVEKFFLDALVEAEKLPDDNFLFCPEVTYKYGEHSPKNPRIEIIIKDLHEI